MNPHIDQLHSYPFEKLAALKQGIHPEATLAHIALSIGEPQHAAPAFVLAELKAQLSQLSRYPSTRGLPQLRQAIARWLQQRFDLAPDSVDPDTQILPVNGTREALFAIAQAMIDPRSRPVVMMPNPFYQIYEGAALLSGAEPYYLNTTTQTDFLPDFESVPESVWQRCRLIYICSPGNPTGRVIPVPRLQWLIEAAERYDFVIASDECYSEIYMDEHAPGRAVAGRGANGQYTVRALRGIPQPVQALEPARAALGFRRRRCAYPGVFFQVPDLSWLRHAPAPPVCQYRCMVR